MKTSFTSKNAISGLIKEILRLCRNALMKFYKRCLCLGLLHMIDVLITKHTRKATISRFYLKKIILKIFIHDKYTF